MLYPTWNRFLKMWKSIILPVMNSNLDINQIEKPTNDEDYILSVNNNITDSLIDRLIVEVSNAIADQGYDVENYSGGEADIIVKGREDFDPEIWISIFHNEPDDYEILDAWDDMRWNSDDIFDDSFNPSYAQWLEDHNAVDTSSEIRKGTRAEKQLYCDWVRSKINEIAITTRYVE